MIRAFGSAIILTMCLSLSATGQRHSSKVPAFLGKPIITDSASTLFIPKHYNQGLLSDNKIAFWNVYFANILVYNFKTDSSYRLFEKDTYIQDITPAAYPGYYRRENNTNMITASWVFMLVKPKDTSGGGRIDVDDATVLYVVSTTGQNLHALTSTRESVVEVEIYEKRGFALIKIQRDSNNDGAFKSDERDYYYQKINLQDLSIGKVIEML